MDGFEQMVDAAQGFFAELKENNSRDWFEPRKQRFEQDIRKPAQLFTDLMADELGRLTGDTHTGKLFRIYRDVRFSKDKTPYNPWVHILWSPGRAMVPAFFFACEPGMLRLFFGVTELKGESLARYRAFVDTQGPALDDAIAQTGGTLADFGAAPLKRVPKPYDPDHPQGQLLRRKGLVLGRDLPGDWRARGLVAATRDGAKAFLPLRQMMAEGL